MTTTYCHYGDEWVSCEDSHSTPPTIDGAREVWATWMREITLSNDRITWMLRNDSGRWVIIDARSENVWAIDDVGEAALLERLA